MRWIQIWQQGYFAMSGWINLKWAFMCRSIWRDTLIPVQIQARINQDGWSWKPNLVTFSCQSGKREEVCVFKLSKEIGFRLPHNRVIDICLDFFLLEKHGRKRIFYHKCQELSSFCSFLLEAANKLFGLPPSPPMRNSSKWIQSETLLHFSSKVFRCNFGQI